MVVQESWPGSLSLSFTCFWLSKVFNPPLRIDSPICNHCCYGTFLHFSLQVFLLLGSEMIRFLPSHLNVCYYHQDLYWSRFHARSLLHSSIMITSFYGWSPPFLSSKTRQEICCAPNSQSKSVISASSIFRTNSFGRWVITHSLADFDFHDHRPTVSMNWRLLWFLMNHIQHVKVWHFYWLFGSSHVASSAYQKWPTKSSSYSFQWTTPPKSESRFLSI